MDLAFKIYDCPAAKAAGFKLNIAIAQASWFLDRFTTKEYVIAGMGQYAPIIAYRGPSGSGKNRALNATRLNSYRPFFDQATTRIPSLFRPLDQWKGTLCIDECDLGKTDETAEVVHYLNCRCTGTPISRQNPDKPGSAQAFSNFGLTIVTQRRVWDDNATEDRSLPHYCEKSSKDIPTTELDEWMEEGMTVQAMLLYLRLAHWGKVRIDKAARIEGISDHRLTASVLPLPALRDHAPVTVQNITQILKELEMQRRRVKAMSADGIVVNFLWDKVHEGMVGEHNGALYVGSSVRVLNEGERREMIVPLQTSEIAQEMKWSPKSIRSIIQSLQLHDGAVAEKAHLFNRSFRPIWFTPAKVERLLMEFVVDYSPGELGAVLKGAGVVTGAEGAEGADKHPDLMAQVAKNKPVDWNQVLENKSVTTDIATAPSAPSAPVLSTDLENLPWLPDEAKNTEYVPIEKIPAKVAEMGKNGPKILEIGSYLYIFEDDGKLFRQPVDLPD